MGNCVDKASKSADPKSGSPNGKEAAKASKKPSGASNYDKNKIGGGGKKAHGGRSSTVHSVIMQEHKLDVYKKYTETEVLGNGSMGHVAKVKIKADFNSSGGRIGSSGSQAKNENSEKSASKEDSDDSHCYALKSIQLDRVSTAFIEELKNEINILKAMDHPNIVKLHEVFSHKKQIYMILELCDGGDLYTRLPYTEKDSAYITGKLLSAIKYMHDHGIVHRDLKFENIMFENKSQIAEIKVIDFGLSKKFASNKLGVMREGVGTLYSMAPQVLQGVYTSQADMWSVGVITYMLLSSHRPFYNKKRKIMIDRIMRVDYTFKKDYWVTISDEAKDFIDHLLVLDPKVRYNAEKAQKHEWMHKEFKTQERAPTESMTGRVTDNIMMFKNNASLKKLALNVIAHRSSTREILNLRKAFNKFDSSGDGVISSEEFATAFQDKSSYTNEEIKEMFDSIDINKNGHIMYTEFIAATLEAQGQLDEEIIAQAFNRLDVDNTGCISKENLLEFLGDTDASMEDVEHMIEQADVDHCGGVSFDEFLAMFRSEKNEVGAGGSAHLLSSLKLFVSDMDEQAGSTSDVTNESSDNLVGLDAVIPGGKYDTEREMKEEEN